MSKSEPRLSAQTTTNFHLKPLVLLSALLVVLYGLFYVPPGSVQPVLSSNGLKLDVFGAYWGSVVVFGVHLSHGWIALSLALFLPLFVFAFGTPLFLFLAFEGAALLLVWSDLTADMTGAYFIANTAGVEISLVIGAFAALMLASIVTGSRK